MLRLKTVLLWIAVAALALAVIAIPVAMGQWVDRPTYLVLPLWIGTIAALAVTAIALRQSIREDREQLPDYENETWNRSKPLVLLASAVFFGMVATSVAIGAAENPPETCTYSAGVEECELNLSLGSILVSSFFMVAFMITPALIAISSAAALVRDALQHRQANA